MRILTIILIKLSAAILFADPPAWVDDPGAYEFTATMTALIEVNNLQFGDAEDILAAFD